MLAEEILYSMFILWRELWNVILRASVHLSDGVLHGEPFLSADGIEQVARGKPNGVFVWTTWPYVSEVAVCIIQCVKIAKPIQPCDGNGRRPSHSCGAVQVHGFPAFHEQIQLGHRPGKSNTQTLRIEIWKWDPHQLDMVRFDSFFNLTEVHSPVFHVPVLLGVEDDGHVLFQLQVIDVVRCRGLRSHQQVSSSRVRYPMVVESEIEPVFEGCLGVGLQCIVVSFFLVFHGFRG
mmetsp:Transcript_9923/g.60572  ORF Transcript_9923/g.60572 Transcript_9923/m.60572 type:complete len:234 (+) Transcript_9923:3402-4103(+)